jgi:hypothetical protein
MYRCLAALIVSIVVAPVICHTQSEPAKCEATSEELVALLVSPNSPANPNREPFIGIPRSHDNDAQKKVEAAAVKLTERGFEAIPALLKGLDDKRHCRSRSYSVVYDFSVGEVCYQLIEEIVTPKVAPNDATLPEAQHKVVKGYPMRIGKDGDWHYTHKTYFNLLYRDDKSFNRQSLSKWWDERKFKSIEEIHLDAVKRMIAYEDSVGFPENAKRSEYLKLYLDLQRELQEKLSVKK